MHISGVEDRFGNDQDFNLSKTEQIFNSVELCRSAPFQMKHTKIAIT